jgi:hypothetical protein
MTLVERHFVLGGFLYRGGALDEMAIWDGVRERGRKRDEMRERKRKRKKYKNCGEERPRRSLETPISPVPSVTSSLSRYNQTKQAVSFS